MVKIYSPPREIISLPPSDLLDPLGRLRVSPPETLVQIKQDTSINRDLTATWGLVDGSGITGSEEGNTFVMTGTGTYAYYIFRSKKCGLYQNGKSLFIYFAFNFNGFGGQGISKRVGYFTSYPSLGKPINGVYLEQKNGVTNWCLANGITPTLKIPQSQWLTNTTNMDWAQPQIGFINFDYFGDIICGFVQKRKLVVSYVFNQENTPLMKTPNHFLSYEMFLNRGDTTTTSFTAISASCQIEGGLQKMDYPFSINRRDTLTLSKNTPTPIIILENKEPNQRVLLSNFEVCANTPSTVLIEFCKIECYSFLGQETGNVNNINYWFPTGTVSFTRTPLLSSTGYSKTIFNQYLETGYDDTGFMYALVAISSADNVSLSTTILNLSIET